jgi:hypothetical protein
LLPRRGHVDDPSGRALADQQKRQNSQAIAEEICVMVGGVTERSEGANSRRQGLFPPP